MPSLRISQRITRAAVERYLREGHALLPDGTHDPVLLAERRATVARRIKGQRAFRRQTMRQLVEQVRTTPRPPRSVRRAAARLFEKETAA